MPRRTGQRGDAIGLETGAGDEVAGLDQTGGRLEDNVRSRAVDTGHVATGEDRAAGLLDVLGVRARDLTIVDDAGFRRVERTDPRRVRLELA